jgi:hypothetical protein
MIEMAGRGAMRRLYLVLACLILLLGLVHVSATFALFDALTSRAVWFAGGGMAIIFTGVLNLLNRAYGAAAPGVRWAAIGGNAAMTVFAALAGVAGAASGAELIVIVGLMAAATLVSLRPHPVSA